MHTQSKKKLEGVKMIILTKIVHVPHVHLILNIYARYVRFTLSFNYLKFINTRFQWSSFKKYEKTFQTSSFETTPPVYQVLKHGWK